MGYVLCTRPTIWIPDQYVRKQDGVHLSGIQMDGLSGIQTASNLFSTIQISDWFCIKIHTVLGFKMVHSDVPFLDVFSIWNPDFFQISEAN